MYCWQGEAPFKVSRRNPFIASFDLWGLPLFFGLQLYCLSLQDQSLLMSLLHLHIPFSSLYVQIFLCLPLMGMHIVAFSAHLDNSG